MLVEYFMTLLKHLIVCIMTYYYQNYIFMELNVKLGSGLNNILIAGNKE
jgi:hypothetical protein